MNNTLDEIFLDTRAVESKKYRSFFTMNINESKILCVVLKQLLYFLPPNYERGIEEYDFRDFKKS